MTMMVLGDYKRDTIKPPEYAHWAILVKDVLAGDDGWGGTRRDEILRYYVYDDEKTWKAALLDLQRQKLERKYGYGDAPAFYGIHVDKVAQLNVSLEVK